MGVPILGYVYVNSVYFDYTLIVLTVSTFFLYCYGYAFNDLCERNKRLLMPWPTFFTFLPLSIACAIVLFFAKQLVPIFVAIALLNTLYIAPLFQYKHQPLLSIILNLMMFGLGFTCGMFIKDANKSLLAMVFMNWYCAMLFLPAQLLHELEHCLVDGKKNFILKNQRTYSALVKWAVIAILLISLVAYKICDVQWLFLCAQIPLVIFVIALFREKENKTYSRKHAHRLRNLYRLYGLCCGMLLLMSFL